MPDTGEERCSAKKYELRKLPFIGSFFGIWSRPKELKKDISLKEICKKVVYKPVWYYIGNSWFVQTKIIYCNNGIIMRYENS